MKQELNQHQVTVKEFLLEDIRDYVKEQIKLYEDPEYKNSKFAEGKVSAFEQVLTKIKN